MRFEEGAYTPPGTEDRKGRRIADKFRKSFNNVSSDLRRSPFPPRMPRTPLRAFRQFPPKLPLRLREDVPPSLSSRRLKKGATATLPRHTQGIGFKASRTVGVGIEDHEGHRVGLKDV